MKQYLIPYFIGLASMLIIDFIWLNIMGPRFYKTYIGYLFADNINFVAAFLMYAFYIGGLVFLVIAPAITGDFSMQKVLIMGLVFGFVAYGAYDLTNQATIKDWPVIVTIVDMIWGSVLTGAVSVITYALTIHFKG